MNIAPVILLKRSRSNGVPWLATAFIALIVAIGCVPHLFASHPPLAQDIAHRLRPPSLDHVFGTDALGRDLFSRVAYGARASLSTAVVALGFAFALSLLIGLTAGYLGGAIDRALMSIVDVLLALPSILLSLLIVSGLGTGAFNLGLAVGLASVPSFARVCRAEVMRVSTQDFVEAATGYGLPRRLVLVRHILPHARGPLLTLGALEFATMILSVSALSFLGYGTRPPDPEWGNLIAEGRAHFATAWWLTTLPGLVLAGVVLALHRVARTFGASSTGIA